MKRLKTILFIIAVLFLTTNILADSSSKLDKSKKTHKIENWYHMLSFGYSDTKIDGQKIQSDLSMNIDFLRFYWRMGSGKQLLFGLGINGSFFTSGSDQLNIYLYSIGFQYYFNEIGKGFYLRGDVGMSYANIMSTSTVVAESGYSYGFLAGIGYGIPISYETRILLEAAYRYLDIEGYPYKTMYFSVGWLW